MKGVIDGNQANKTRACGTWAKIFLLSRFKFLLPTLNITPERASFTISIYFYGFHGPETAEDLPPTPARHPPSKAVEILFHADRNCSEILFSR